MAISGGVREFHGKAIPTHHAFCKSFTYTNTTHPDIVLGIFDTLSPYLWEKGSQAGTQFLFNAPGVYFGQFLIHCHVIDTGGTVGTYTANLIWDTSNTDDGTNVTNWISRTVVIAAGIAAGANTMYAVCNGALGTIAASTQNGPRYHRFTLNFTTFAGGAVNAKITPLIRFITGPIGY